MNVLQSLAETRRMLESANIPDAQVEASAMLMHATGMTREQLYASLRDPITLAAAKMLRNTQDRRLTREPLPYITGHREFFGIDLRVDTRVLVPRQETESIVEATLTIAQNSYAGACRIADVGTGSGAIALSLATHLPHSVIQAIDCSQEALDLAAVNCRRLNLENRVKCLKGDLLQPLEHPVDIIVANLPYIRESEWASLQPEIRAFEPKEALLSGKDGLDHIRRLLGQVRQIPSPPKWVILELDVKQVMTIAQEASNLFHRTDVSTISDLNGQERGVIVKKRTGRTPNLHGSAIASTPDPRPTVPQVQLSST